MPTFFIVGAGKAGTTSLHALLATHPDVFMPRIKEPHYFSSVTPPEGELFSRITERAEYEKQFSPGQAALARGEASTTYLPDIEAPARIRSAVPNAQIIILLRDPIQRAYSHYLMRCRMGWENRSFKQAVRAEEAAPRSGWGYIEQGRYGSQIDRYVREFGPNRVLVLLTQDLRQKPASVLEKVAHFLDVSPEAFQPLKVPKQLNPYGVPRFRGAQRIIASRSVAITRQFLPLTLRHWIRNTMLIKPQEKPPLELQVVAQLQDIFEPELSRLEAILKRQLPELRASWIARS